VGACSTLLFLPAVKRTRDPRFMRAFAWISA